MTPRLPTDALEFERFHLILTKDRPDYEPHYIKVNAGDTVKRNDGGKPIDKNDNVVSEDSPDRVNLGKKSAGKHTKITKDAAIRRLKRGENVGIEAHKDDDLVLIDIDDTDVINPSELKPTLTTMSRKRKGYHGIYFAADPNDERITKNTTISEVGEIRSDDYYVLAPGSWVDTFDLKEPIPEDEIKNAGKYTIHSDKPVADISFDEIPQAFKDHHAKKAIDAIESERIATERAARKAAREAGGDATAKGEKTRLFKLEMSDVVTLPARGKYFKNPLHPNASGESAFLSNEGVFQCFAHSVSHTALSALSVLAGLYDCESAGQAHGNSNAGGSMLTIKDPRTVWALWSYAIREGFLRKDDPIPWDAFKWYAINQGVIVESDLKDGYKMPPGAVTQTKGIIKSKEKIEIINIGTYPKPKPKPKTPQPETPGNAEDYFTEKTFIAKRLAEKLMQRHVFKTMKDTGEIFSYDGGIYIGKAITTIEAEAQVELNEKSNNQRVKEVVGYIQRATYVNRDDFDADKDIINLENGLFDFKTMEIKPHTPTYLSLRKAPIFYDEGAICPRTDKFFDEVLLKKDIILMYELFGYTLVKGKSMSEAIILEGEGSNGKSVMIDLLNAFVGESATSHVTPHKLSDDTYAAADLFGKLLNTVDDLGNSPLTKLGVFKSVVACKPIRAHNKFERGFNFKPDALCVFACNDVPPTTDTSDAFFRRMILIPFLKVFVKGENDNPNLINELTTRQAISGLFNVAIAAAKGAIEHGKFTGVGTVDEKKRAYTYASHPVARFVDEECTMSDPDDYISKNELYQQYTLWSRDRGIRVRDHASLTNYLKPLGITDGQPVQDDGSRLRSYMGINMKRVI